jgi:hypothetical protein
VVRTEQEERARVRQQEEARISATVSNIERGRIRSETILRLQNEEYATTKADSAQMKVIAENATKLIETEVVRILIGQKVAERLHQAGVEEIDARTHLARVQAEATRRQADAAENLAEAQTRATEAQAEAAEEKRRYFRDKRYS